MAKFPKDAPKRKVVKALEALGFRKVREKEHISMIRENADGTNTPLTMPNHRKSRARRSDPFAVKLGLPVRTSSPLTKTLSR